MSISEREPPRHPLVRGGDTGELLRSLDWTQTPLEPIERWPDALLSAVNTCLNSCFPMLVMWGPQHAMVYNDGYRRILGDRHPHALGRPYSEVWPEIWHEIEPMVSAALLDGEAFWQQRRLHILERKGFREAGYFTYSISPIFDGAQIGGVLIVISESTREVLDERRISTLRRLATDTADSQSVEEAGAAALAALDWRDVPFALLYRATPDNQRAELLASSFSPRAELAPDSFDLGEGQPPWPMQRILDTGQPCVIEFEPAVYPTGHPSGESAATRAVVYPLAHAASASPNKMLVLGHNDRLIDDVAYRDFFDLLADQIEAAIERTYDRQEARERANELYDLFMQAPVPICVLRGEDLRFDMANSRLEQVTGRQNLTGRTLLDAMPEFGGQGFVRLLHGVMHTGQPHVDSEAHLRLDRDGDGKAEDTYWTFIYAPLRNEHGIIDRVTVFCHDVTDQVEARRQSEQIADRLREEEQRKNDFLAMLGHELRNPLVPIVTGLEILEYQCKGDDIDVPLAAMKRQVDALTRIVDDLLDVSRINRGRIELRRESIDLAEAVRHALDSTRSFVDSYDHRVDVDFDDEAMPLSADPVRLEQILVNLLTNAAKYTEQGGHIWVRVFRDGGDAVVSVRDNGQGMSEAMLSEVFGLFNQAHQDLAREQGGLGIGLTVVRSLVEEHGGSVCAHSEGLGKGSEFVVRLPLAASGPAERRLN